SARRLQRPLDQRVHWRRRVRSPLLLSTGGRQPARTAARRAPHPGDATVSPRAGRGHRRDLPSLRLLAEDGPAHAALVITRARTRAARGPRRAAAPANRPPRPPAPPARARARGPGRTKGPG